MNIHLQILATGFYAMSQTDGLSSFERRAYERLARSWVVLSWLLTGTYRRNIARERARDRRDLWLEFRNRSEAAERRVAKLLWNTQRDDAWNALLAGAH